MAKPAKAQRGKAKRPKAKSALTKRLKRPDLTVRTFDLKGPVVSRTKEMERYFQAVLEQAVIASMETEVSLIYTNFS
jgi:ribosome biogenesis GTPase A